MRDNEVPSNGYKTQLSNASLGEKKITFEKKTLCNYFHEKLLESYPKLKEGGGYELMRTKFRSTSKLEILQPKGNAGHNVLDLKEMVASARIYVRPLQNDLSPEQIEHASLVSSPLIITSSLYCKCYMFLLIQCLTLSLETLQHKGLEKDLCSTFTRSLSMKLDLNIIAK